MPWPEIINTFCHRFGVLWALRGHYILQQNLTGKHCLLCFHEYSKLETAQTLTNFVTRTITLVRDATVQLFQITILDLAIFNLAISMTTE